MSRQFEQLDLLGRGKPIRGMRSAVDPAQLPDGFWQVVENLRITGLSVQARREPRKLNNPASPLVSGATGYLGHFYGYLNGVRKLFVAYGGGSPSAGRIYAVNFSSSPWTASEISNSTTRFTSSTQPVEFAAYRDPGAGFSDAPREYLMICNGSETNRILDPTTGPESLYLGESVGVPVVSEFTTKPIPTGYINIAESSKWVSSESGGFTLATSGSSGTLEIQIGMSTSVNAGDTFTIAISAGGAYDIVNNSTSNVLNLTNSDQLWLVCADKVSDPIWNYVDLKVESASVEYLIYSCSGQNRQEPVYIELNSSYYLVGFTIDYNPGGFSGGSISKLIGSCARKSTVLRTVKIAGVLAGGLIPGGTEYALSYANRNTRIESRALAPKLVRSGVAFEYGMSKNLTFDIPQSKSLHYAYRHSWFHPTSAGATQLWVYRKDIDDTEFFLSGQSDILAANGALRITYDVLAHEYLERRRIAPRLTNQGPPVGVTVCGANNRLYIGGSYEGGSNADALNQVWISDEGYPTRFTPIASDEDDDGVPDATSGAYNRFPSERIRRIVSLPAFLGTASVLVFTDKGVRRIDGNSSLDLTRPTLVNEHGTASPRSVAINQQDVYYLDSDGVVRRISGGIESQPISLWKIDDQLRLNTATAKAFGVWWQEKYYLAITDGGSSLNRILVYESQLDEWVRDSYSGFSWNVLFSDDSQYPRRLLGFARNSSDENVYQVEDPTQTAAPTISLKTRQIEVDGWQRLLWGSVGAVADKDSNTWTTTRVDPFDSTNTVQAVGKLNLNVSPERAWIEDRTVSGGMCGITSPALELSISGAYTPGKYLRKLVLLFEGRGGGGYRPSA